MKVYTPSDFKKLAIEMLEKVSKENIKRIAIGWVSSSSLENELGKISYIQICEREIHSEKDFNRWQQRIQITPQKIIKYFDTENNKFRNFSDVLRDIKNCESLGISICVRIIKKIEKNKYLVKLFNKYFIMKTSFNFRYDFNSRFNHEWIYVCDEKENHAGIDNAEFVEVSKDEIIAELI